MQWRRDGESRTLGSLRPLRQSMATARSMLTGRMAILMEGRSVPKMYEGRVQQYHLATWGHRSLRVLSVESRLHPLLPEVHRHRSAAPVPKSSGGSPQRQGHQGWNSLPMSVVRLILPRHLDFLPLQCAEQGPERQGNPLWAPQRSCRARLQLPRSAAHLLARGLAVLDCLQEHASRRRCRRRRLGAHRGTCQWRQPMRSPSQGMT